MVSDRSVLEERRKLGFHLPYFTGLTQGQAASIAVHSPAPETGQSQLQFAYKILQQIHPYLWYLQQILSSSLKYSQTPSPYKICPDKGSFRCPSMHNLSFVERISQFHENWNKK